MPDHAKSHAHRLRTGRYPEPGRIYWLTTVVQDRKALFSDWHLGRLLVQELRRAENERQVVSLAWVVMPDHLHWLIELIEGSLEMLMRRVKSRSTLAINAANGRSGQLWQRGYHDHVVRREEDLKALARYVVANPLRARLVGRMGDYPLWDAIWL
ncbi:MAG: REP-associated tyrosine transposase [Pseudomonas sp.]